MIEGLDLWTDDEIYERILSLLNPGVEFWCGEEGQAWVAKLEESDSSILRTTPATITLWRAEDFTRRGVLFQAFHHLWSPDAPQGLWSVNPARPSLRAVAQRISEKYADPEDLDPSEVRSVYNSDSRSK